MAGTKTPMTKAQHHAVADALFKAWNDHDVELLAAEALPGFCALLRTQESLPVRGDRVAH